MSPTQDHARDPSGSRATEKGREMSGGPNGQTPGERLKAIERSRYSATGGEAPVMSKCELHPSKRAWSDPLEAVREAEARSEAAKMSISAYRCDSCKQIHLCKTSNAREGSIVTRPEPRNFEVFMPTRPGNKAAREKMLRAFLDGKIKVSTEEVIEAIGPISRHTASTLMRAAGWTIPRGPGARWTRLVVAEKPVDEAVDKPTLRAIVPPPPTEREAAISRHPSGQINPWLDLERIETLRHIPVGDLIDMLRATGAELRIQHRRAHS